jgi:hypothetical protein
VIDDVEYPHAADGPDPILLGSPDVTPLYSSQIAIFLEESPTIVIPESVALSPRFELMPTSDLPGAVTVTFCTTTVRANCLEQLPHER